MASVVFLSFIYGYFLSLVFGSVFKVLFRFFTYILVLFKTGRKLDITFLSRQVKEHHMTLNT